MYHGGAFFFPKISLGAAFQPIFEPSPVLRLPFSMFSLWVFHKLQFAISLDPFGDPLFLCQISQFVIEGGLVVLGEAST